MDSYRSRQCSEILKCSQKCELGVFSGTRVERPALPERTSVDVDDKFYEIKKLFDLRINNLQNSIREVYDAVLYDPIIQTLRKERNDEALIMQRVSEILNNVIASEKEMCIEKLSKQFTVLKSENTKLKEIVEKLEDKNYQSELEKSFQEVQKELKKEIRSKAQLEEEVISLRQKLKDIEAKYEEFVNRKDAQLNSHREIDRKEVHLLREQMRELEADLSSKNQLIEVKNQELETYIKESVAQNHKISELEKNLRDAKDQANDYKNLYEKIEATNQNLRQKSKEMSETIKHLQTSLNQAEGKLYENYEKIQKEQDTFREDISRIEAKYNERIVRYKEKIKNYKSKYFDAESAVNQLKSAVYDDDNGVRLETFSEHPTHRGEMKTELEPLNVAIERIRWEKEEKRTYEKQVRDLGYELSHLKDQSNRQIAELHARVQELELLLAERDKYINSEYVTITYHDMKMREKQLLIDKLKEELSTLEQASKIETARVVKTNTRELQDYEEFVKKQLALLEQEVESVSKARNAAEDSLNKEKAKVQELEGKISKHEMEQKKMAQYISEVEQANERFKNNSDNDKATIADLKDKLEAIKKEKQRAETQLSEVRQQLESRMQQNEALRFNLEQVNKLQDEQKDQILQLYRNNDSLREEHEAKMIEKAQEIVKFEEVIQELEKIVELKVQELEKEKLSKDNCQFKLLTVEKELEMKTSEADSLRRQLKRQKSEHKANISNLLWKCEGLKRQLSEIMDFAKKDIVNIQSTLEMSITNFKSFTLGLIYSKKAFELKESQSPLPVAQSRKESLVSESSREPLKLLENTQNASAQKNTRGDIEELSRLIKKNFELESLLEKTKTHYIADISILKKEIISMQELAIRDRNDLENHYEGQIENYKREVNAVKREKDELKSHYEGQIDNCREELQSVKEVLTNIRSEYEEQMRKTDEEHEEEVRCLQEKYTVLVQELTSHKIKIEQNDMDNSGRVRQLIDRIDELEFDNARLAREKQLSGMKLEETKKAVEETKRRVDELEQLLLFERRKTQNMQRENMAEARNLKRMNEEFENDISNTNERLSAVLKERQQNHEISARFPSRAHTREQKSGQHDTFTPKKIQQENLVPSTERRNTWKDVPPKREIHREQTTQRRQLTSATQASRSNSIEREGFHRRLDTDYSERSPLRKGDTVREDLPTFSRRDSYKVRDLRNSFIDPKNKFGEYKEKSEY